ncbi:MAG: hypothetical protein C0483_00400 [Pirellula sp.]|nr:hypothetical protein [Pirellula sp.]
MIFDWLTNRRRRKLIAQPFPAAWSEVLESDLHHYARLTPAEQTRVRDYVRVFVAEKNWEGCGGLALTDEMKVVIAGLVAVLVLGFPPVYFDAVVSLLIYPAGYVAQESSTNRHGVIVEGNSVRLGEAWYRGPVILSWSDVSECGRGFSGGRNVVAHEFAHQLDMLNGRQTDGVPPLESDAQRRRWNVVMAREYEQLVRAYELNEPTVLDYYGATSRVEFFAVATESFFEAPGALQTYNPELYALLRDFYRQDPALREANSR